MAKTYIDTVKYVVYASVEIDGLVEKPDVVGAVFGQTEGLLGDELDLRDSQKNGRIGRIEVDLNPTREGKTVGSVKIPSSLDMVETCIVAAALETVDRVGPCEAKIRVQKVEDTRNVKRKVLVDRAKDLLKNLINTEIPESKEISEMVRNEVKTAEIVEYGFERLPAGPSIDKMDEVIFVEGRADVINLLKNDITNVVAIQGAKVPKSLVELSKSKEVTVFLDGDRGGDIILRELVQGGVEIEHIARAPSGKEVEELTRKELIKCLRTKLPFEQNGRESNEDRQDRENRRRQMSYEPTPSRQKSVSDQIRTDLRMRRPEVRVELSKEPVREVEVPKSIVEAIVQDIKPPVLERVERSERVERVEKVEKAEKEAVAPVEDAPPREPRSIDDLKGDLDQLSNTLRARFYDHTYNITKEVAVRDVIKSLEEVKDIAAIVFDGIITQRLVDLSNNKGVKVLMGVKIGNVNKTPPALQIITKMK